MSHELPSMSAFTRAWEAADATALQALYDTRSQVVTPDAVVLSATEIGAFFQGGFDSIVVEFEAQEQFTSDELHVERGWVRDVRRQDGKVVETCHYLAVWRRDSAGWRILHHTWSAPVSPAPPSDS